MDQRWNSVLKDFLEFPEEIGAVFVSPTHAEVWKGTTDSCPYFKKYQEEPKVVVHSHPPSEERAYSPPSPTDLLNCIESPNPHVVISKEGFWVYSATPSLKSEWSELDDEKRNTLSEIIVNNCFGLTASLVGGSFMERFAEGVPRVRIDVETFLNQMRSVIPRKDPSLPALGFELYLTGSIPETDIVFDSSYKPFGYEWDVESVTALKERIKETKTGDCVTSDGSFVAF